MSQLNSSSEFLTELELILSDHIGEENFGVSELAKEVGMSRSNLLRKIKKETKLSASVYIRQERLKAGMSLLKKTSLNVSEVAYEVGFNSVSYFIKCFREYYGYPPGKVGKRSEEEIPESETKRSSKAPILVLIFLAVLVSGYLIYWNSAGTYSTKEELAKSIAVLPFRNESSDSSNVYLINGVMESILNNLQKIEDIRVISRTSVEKFRNEKWSMPEIANELNVSYLVEGSGQKIGDQILLNIRLIEGKNDRRVWGEQYNRRVEDIFNLQAEVAKLIAGNIEVVLSPSTIEQIERPITDNDSAYLLYLRADGHMRQATSPDDLQKASVYLKEATILDPEFAAAYANLTICYYYMDLFRQDKIYADSLRENSDRAMLYDNQIPQSLIAKAFYHMSLTEHDIAAQYLEKAHRLMPNSSDIINLLSDYYARHNPNTAKYLEYALKGMQIDIAPEDSITASFKYLHLSNALVQTGFVEQALDYIDKSIALGPENGYSDYVKAYILFAKTRDLANTRKLLVEEYEEDTTRMDILVEVCKMFYFERDYENAHKYFDALDQRRREANLAIYTHENLKAAHVYREMGFFEEAKDFLESFKGFADNDPSIYQPLSMASYYTYQGDNEKALDYMNQFKEVENFQYWVILFYELDPIYEELKNHKDFKQLFDQFEVNFWNQHQRVKERLKEKKLL